MISNHVQICEGVEPLGHVFAILPTGYGKSLHYACLPRVYNYLLDATSSIVVVVTPLTDTLRIYEIMKDRVH